MTLMVHVGHEVSGCVCGFMLGRCPVCKGRINEDGSGGHAGCDALMRPYAGLPALMSRTEVADPSIEMWRWGQVCICVDCAATVSRVLREAAELLGWRKP